MLVEAPRPTDDLETFKRRVCLAISRLSTSKLGQTASPTFAGLTIGSSAISGTLIGQWNTAYSWGDHAGLYDPIGTAAGEIVTHESTYNHSNYNAAYSHKVTEDALNGLVFCNGAGSYSAKVIGTDVQAYGAGLTAIAGLSNSDGNIIVGDGTTWVAESGATARTSLGLGTADSVTFAGVTSTVGASFTKTATSSGQTGTSLYLTVDTSAGDLTYGTGCKFRAICSGANNLINGLIGAYGTASHEGSGTVAIGRGVVGLNQTTAGGTITAAWDFYANPPGVSGGGAIGSSGGVYIAAQKITGVTTGYGIYQVGADDINNFVGKCKFGTSGTPAENVHASDTVRADIAFNLNGTDGVTQAASAGTVCDVTALAGGIATAQTQVTYIADGAHSLSGITSITTVNGRITAMA